MVLTPPFVLGAKSQQRLINEAFRNYLHRVIHVRTIPLAYIIRPKDGVPLIGTQATGAPHLTEHKSVETELIS